MAVKLTETIRDLGRSLSERCLNDGDDFPRHLCEALEALLLPDFQIGFVGVTGKTGDILLESALLIYTRSSEITGNSLRYVASERELLVSFMP